MASTEDPFPHYIYFYFLLFKCSCKVFTGIRTRNSSSAALCIDKIFVYTHSVDCYKLSNISPQAKTKYKNIDFIRRRYW